MLKLKDSDMENVAIYLNDEFEVEATSLNISKSEGRESYAFSTIEIECPSMQCNSAFARLLEDNNESIYSVKFDLYVYGPVPEELRQSTVRIAPVIYKNCQVFDCVYTNSTRKADHSKVKYSLNVGNCQVPDNQFTVIDEVDFAPQTPVVEVELVNLDSEIESQVGNYGFVESTESGSDRPHYCGLDYTVLFDAHQAKNVESITWHEEYKTCTKMVDGESVPVTLVSGTFVLFDYLDTLDPLSEALGAPYTGKFNITLIVRGLKNTEYLGKCMTLTGVEITGKTSGASARDLQNSVSYTFKAEEITSWIRFY